MVVMLGNTRLKRAIVRTAKLLCPGSASEVSASNTWGSPIS